jgi:hypothetical protein
VQPPFCPIWLEVGKIVLELRKIVLELDKKVLDVSAYAGLFG